MYSHIIEVLKIHMVFGEKSWKARNEALTLISVFIIIGCILMLIDSSITEFGYSASFVVGSMESEMSSGLWSFLSEATSCSLLCPFCKNDDISEGATVCRGCGATIHYGMPRGWNYRLSLCCLIYGIYMVIGEGEEVATGVAIWFMSYIALYTLFYLFTRNKKTFYRRMQ